VFRGSILLIESPPPTIELRTDEIQQGSKTAKAGFQNERDVVATFNQWKTNPLSQQWLEKLLVVHKTTTKISAKVVTGSQKTDIQVTTTSATTGKDKHFNIQVKLVSNKKGFNQIDKRWNLSYKAKWNTPADTHRLLQYFTGELPPYKAKSRDKRRMFFDEMTTAEQKNVIDFFTKNKALISKGLFQGNGPNAAEWFLVIRKDKAKQDWALLPIDKVIAHYSKGEVKLSQHGSLRIGKISMQRKGGDNGRPTANMLQFKIDPTELLQKDPKLP